MEKKQNKQFTIYGWLSWHQAKICAFLPHFPPTGNQCLLQFLSCNCKCECKLSEMLQCRVLIVNASTCMRAAVAFISPLCDRRVWEARLSKAKQRCIWWTHGKGSLRHTASPTHTHTLAHTQVYWQWPLMWRWKPVTFTLVGLLRWGLGKAAVVKTTENGSNWNLTRLEAS